MESLFTKLSTLLTGVMLLLYPENLQPPKLVDKYWGPGDEPRNIDTSIRPFKIQFSKEMITDLRYRLNNTRTMEPSLEHSGWTRGVNREFIPIIVDQWLNEYDFKKREKHLNQFPQFITNVQGLDIHYIHVKPNLRKCHKKIRILPLLMLHGWPGSIVEFYKIIPMLTTPRPDRDFVFEIISPSLPGVGYSDAAAKVGLSGVEVAHLLKNFMIRLGYDRWYTQGGDWGAVITAYMASMYPEHVLGHHSNFCLASGLSNTIKLLMYSIVPSLLPAKERLFLPPLKKFLAEALDKSGYFHQQATRPDTLGVGMTDSPIGFAAYWLEKFSEGTNYNDRFSFDGHLSKFDMNELIDNLMLYWAPKKITSSMRIYAESYKTRTIGRNSLPIKVPSACAQFPNEVWFVPEKILRGHYVNLVHRKIMPQGGHFAALEEPQLLADDVFEAVEKMQKYDVTEQEQ